MPLQLAQNLVKVGVLILIVSFVFSSLGFFSKWNVNSHFQHPWYKDERTIQYAGSICMLIWAIFVALYILNILQPGFVLVFFFLIFPILYLGSVIYGVMLARRKKAV